tara:strand:+ start:687 stop:1313 length:627 start_codon:yes stop_codon:yes gene_type:complete
MTRLAVVIIFGLLLSGCGDSLDVKPGFEFVVDGNAILTDGPVTHCRPLERADTYYCEETQRSNYDYILSSGVFLLIDQERLEQYRLYLEDVAALNFRSPVDYQVLLGQGSVLLLIISDTFSDQNFDGHRVLLHPEALEEIRDPAARSASASHAYSLEGLSSLLEDSCREYLQETNPNAPPQIRTVGGIYWVVPERCVHQSAFIEAMLN